MDKPVIDIFDQCGRVHFTVVSATFGLVVLGTIRKQAELLMRSKPISSNFSWPLLQFLLQGPVLTSLADGWTDCKL